MPKKKTPSRRTTAAPKKTIATPTKPRRATTRTKETASHRKPAAPQVATPAERAKQGRFSPRQLEAFRKQLLELRDQMVDGINFLAGENLNSSQQETSGDLSHYGIHMADQGTDNFDREFALNVVSNVQDLLYEIDEALHRIELGTFGICELTDRPIEIERLRAVPYTRFCLAAQKELEKGRKHYRPFTATGPTSVES